MLRRLLNIIFLGYILCSSDHAVASSISYDGTLSGSFVYSNGVARNFSNLVNTTLSIGVNPPWDYNPLFFEIKHEGNNYLNAPNRSNGICYNFRGFCTSDAIFNLQFASAFYDCVEDGFICGRYPKAAYYVNLPIVDLRAAEITNTSGQMPGVEELVLFYMVRGDEKTYVSNGTVEKYGGRN